MFTRITIAVKESVRKASLQSKRIPFAFRKQEFLRPFSSKLFTSSGITFHDSGGTTGDIRNEDANLDED